MKQNCLFHLIKAINTITLQFESHKDLTMALVRTQCRVYMCRKGDASHSRHVQHFIACLHTAYRGSWVLQAIAKRGMATVGHSESTPSDAAQMDALHAVADAKVL